MPLTQVSAALLSSEANAQGFRNRIINGDMRIDQRNNGSAVTINSATQTYTLDRWTGYGQASDGVFTVQRSTVAPAGFTNSALITVTTADASIGAGQVYAFSQFIEGFNTADLGFGTAGAQTVTVSFLVRSSVTGTYSATLFNSAYNRGYTATFTINAANTFEYKTFTIPGDTAGTWLTDNGVGLRLWIALGTGSTFKGTAGAWNAGTTYGATGQVDLISTNGATFYITGVQLEAGTVAEPFERIDYGRQLIQCQRYFEMSFPQGTAPATNTAKNQSVAMTVGTIGSVEYTSSIKYSVTKRATPILTFYNPNAASNTMRIYGAAGSAGDFPPTINSQSDNSYNLSYTRTGDTIFEFHWAAASEL